MIQDDKGSEKEAELVRRLGQAREQMLAEMHKVIVGQEEVLEELIYAVLCRGHCLLEGVPGLAKTVMVQTLGATLNLTFRRIQFTPDLMPSDITGTDIIQEDPQTGPAPVRVHGRPHFHQSAAGRRNQPHAAQDASRPAGGDAGTPDHLPRPDLRSAQPFLRARDAEPHRAGRHLPAARGAVGPVHVHGQDWLPDQPDEIEILKRTTGDHAPEVKPLFSAEEILQLQKAVRRVPVADMSMNTW